MPYLRAYINEDAISSYYVLNEIPENIGQVEIYENDKDGDTLAVEYESYPTVEAMQDRVDYINSNKLTWDDI